MFERNVTKETYMLQYLNDFKGLFNLENKTEINLMHIIWRDSWSSIEKELLANKDLKIKWSEELGCSLGTVNNTLTKLVNKNLIQTSKRSTYHPNTAFFFEYSGLAESNIQVREIKYIIQ